MGKEFWKGPSSVYNDFSSFNINNNNKKVVIFVFMYNTLHDNITFFLFCFPDHASSTAGTTEKCLTVLIDWKYFHMRNIHTVHGEKKWMDVNVYLSPKYCC